jgi:hypothetical protein
MMEKPVKDIVATKPSIKKRVNPIPIIVKVELTIISKGRITLLETDAVFIDIAAIMSPVFLDI